MDTPRKTGISGDINRIKEGTSASAAELRDFVQQMRGRSPQEMLGLVAESGLFQGIVLSTLSIFALLMVCTVVPYAWGKSRGPAKGTAAPVASAASAPAGESTAPPAATAAPPAGAPAANPAAPQVSEDVLDKLGVGGTKESSLDRNPLDNDKDDLLKDLK